MAEISIEVRNPDLLCEMVSSFAFQLALRFIHILMSAEADGLCGAGYGERSETRIIRRNGYREREFDTRVGTMPLAIPKLRAGSYFPGWLLEPRRRAERALVAVITECYVAGVSTRRVDGLVQTLGIKGISKSRVSEMAKSLDEIVEAFRNWPLDGGPYRYLWLDALTMRCRDGGRIVNVAVVVATAVNADGHREVLGIDVVTTEDGAAWTAFLRGLVARGLSGVWLVTSDAHGGLRAAIASVLPGASWQRCRTHFMRNLLTRVPKNAQGLAATLVRSIFAQPSADEAWAQHARVVEQLAGRFPQAAELLAEAGEEILAYTAFPKEHCQMTGVSERQIWRCPELDEGSNNPQERLNREIRRRTDVVGIFPNRAAVIRLVGAVLPEAWREQTEQHDEWAVTRRYGGADSLADRSTVPIDGDTEKEVKAICSRHASGTEAV